MFMRQDVINIDGSTGHSPEFMGDRSRDSFVVRSVNIFCQKRPDELRDFRSILFQREVSRV